MKTIIVLLMLGWLSYLFADVKSSNFITGFLCPFMFVLSVIGLVLCLYSRSVSFNRGTRRSGDAGGGGGWFGGGGGGDCGGD